MEITVCDIYVMDGNRMLEKPKHKKTRPSYGLTLSDLKVLFLLDFISLDTKMSLACSLFIIDFPMVPLYL